MRNGTKEWTIQQVMDLLMAPVGPLDSTVDRLENGDPNETVRGIAAAFVASRHVVDRAIELGVNLLITHEASYYSHQPNGCYGLAEDRVMLSKKALLEQSGIAVFRMHDYLHRYKPDGVTLGLIKRLGWEPFVAEHRPAVSIMALPEMTVREAAASIKAALGIPYVRIAGDPSVSCRRAGIFVGYRGGGANVIPLLSDHTIDVAIVGEGPEWETPMYVKDAAMQGVQKALIVLGHAESEEPGMRELAERLQAMLPAVPVHFIEDKPLFQVL
ncbi:transcriptional regulator [Paenibacillus sp. NEAU-GSW1]|nr:transcriptional regulator [Paenibacillus sp. NEAU-GSW1]